MAETTPTLNPSASQDPDDFGTMAEVRVALRDHMRRGEELQRDLYFATAAVAAIADAVADDGDDGTLADCQCAALRGTGERAFALAGDLERWLDQARSIVVCVVADDPHANAKARAMCQSMQADAAAGRRALTFGEIEAFRRYRADAAFAAEVDAALGAGS